jgi:hypothetical protein
MNCQFILVICEKTTTSLQYPYSVRVISLQELALPRNNQVSKSAAEQCQNLNCLRLEQLEVDEGFAS